MPFKPSIFVLIGVASLALLIGGIFLFASNPDFGTGKKSPLPEGEGIGQFFPSQGQQHITPGTSHDPYNSNPPSSGPHWPQAAKNGVYDEQLPDEQLIHNLEHGHVWIAYKPDLDSQTVEKLKSIVNQNDWKMVMAPRSANDVPIALVAWTRVLKLESFDQAQIEEFIKTYRDRGPEATPS